MRPFDEEEALVPVPEEIPRAAATEGADEATATDPLERSEEGSSSEFPDEAPTAPNRQRDSHTASSEPPPTSPSQASVGAYRLVRPCPSETIAPDEPRSHKASKRMVLGVASKVRRGP